VKARYYGPDVKYGGPCGVCGRRVDPARAWEACLYRREDGKFVPVHLDCVGGRVKNRVGGSRTVMAPDTIEVR
jgi:hypothetical protein